MDERTENRKKFIINIIFWALVLGLTYFLLKNVASFILPFIIGFCLAAVANHFASKILKRSNSSKSAVSILINILVLAVIGGVIYFIIYLLYTNIRDFVVRNFIDGDMLEQFSGYLAALSQSLPEGLSETLQTFAAGLPSKLVGPVTDFLGKAITEAAPSFIVTLFISIIASFIIVADYKKITTFLVLQLPKKAQEAVPVIKKVFRESIVGLFRSYILIMSITFVELFLGFTVLALMGLNTLGRDLSLLLAAITAVIDIIPVFGTGFILFPWIAIAILQKNYLLAVGLFVLYCIIQVVRQVIEPRLVGQSLGLHPILALMSMYVGVRLLGALGIFIFPLLLLFINSLQKHNILKIYNPLPQTPESNKPPSKGLFKKKNLE